MATIATSGYFNTTSYTITGNRYVIFSWTSSISGSNYVINWSLKGGGNEPTGVDSGPITININGTTKTYYSNSNRIRLYDGTTIATDSTTVIGGADLEVTVSAAIYSFSINCSGHNTWTLPSTETAATMTITLPDNKLIFGNTSNQGKGRPTITLSGTKSSLYYGLYWKAINNDIEETNWSVIKQGTSSQVSSAANSWYLSANQHSSHFTHSNVKIKFALYTYKDTSWSGSSIVGSATILGPFTVNYSTSDPNMRPSIAYSSITDSSGWYTKLSSNLLQTKSNGYISFTVTPYTGNDYTCPISTKSGKINNTAKTVSISGSQYRVPFTGTDYNSSNKSIATLTVYDERGLSAEVSSSQFNWYTYSGSTTLGTCSAYRCNSGGTADNSGTYARISYAGNLVQINGNTVPATLSFSVSSGTAPSSVSPTAASFSGTTSVFGGGNYTIGSTYTFTLTLTQTYGSGSSATQIGSTTKTITLPTGATAFVLAEIASNGSGIAIGQTAINNTFIVSNMKVCLGLESNEALYVAITNLGWTNDVLE